MRSKSKHGRQYQCKTCQRAYRKAHYEANRKRYIVKVTQQHDVYFADVKRFIWDYFIGHPCIDCGETDPVVLEFDHRGDKLANVSALVSAGRSRAIIETEIAKCDVRCCNCHRRKTMRTLGYWRYGYQTTIETPEEVLSG